ncbi:MAG: helix-turn-helix transcriptional regulator [Firmicutes bacterium]|nr:helix-turn-helix transcriptional regulator [Bacillota bacterium]
MKTTPLQIFYSKTSGKYSAAIIDALLDGAKNLNELSEATSFSVSDILHHIDILEKHGLVGRILSVDKNEKAKYTLTKTGYALKDTFDAAKKWGQMYNEKIR